MKQKFFVVMNPVSGTIKVPDVEKYLKRYLTTHYTLYVTTGKEHIPSLVKKMMGKGYERFVAIGGDGTISEVAEGLLGTKVPLVLVPTGTANNLAQELEIPLTIKDAIALTVKSKKTIAIDAMKVKDRYYFLDISIGAKSLAIRDTSRKAKLRFGVLAYMWNSMKKMMAFNPKNFTITTDGKTAHYQATEVVIANAGILGHRAFRYTQSMGIDDGLLHVCVIHAQSLWEYIKVGYRFYKNTDVAKQHVQFLSAEKTVTIQTKANIPIQADGEIIGTHKVQVTLVPQVLHVVVPQ